MKKPEDGLLVRSNCLVFALRQWWRFGGYIVLRRSHYGPFSHVCWSADLRMFEEFVPRDPRRRWVPPLFFLGYVQRFGCEDIPRPR